MSETESSSSCSSSCSLKQLPSSTVRLIGSTQVIVSVFSVVKELVENALDANATSIDIKLDNYGLDKVEIKDNGDGIDSADVPLATKRFFTSKIALFTDLLQLSSYGFRGEALGSLCSVADVTITTRTAKDFVSLVYTFDNQGEIAGTHPSHLGKGTSVSASKLFGKLPVRRQYYNNIKKKKDELKKIEDLVMAFGIIQPGVRLTLRNDKDLIWQKNALSDVETAFSYILGRNLMSQMVTEEFTVDPKIHVKLLIPQAESDVQLTSRSTSDRLFIFVNKRPVTLKSIEKEIKEGYVVNHKCGNVRCPVGFVSLTVPAFFVDFNVDPNKTMVGINDDYKYHIQDKLYNTLQKLYYDKNDVVEASSTESLSSRVSDVSIPRNTTNSEISLCPKYWSSEDTLYPHSTHSENTLSTESSYSDIIIQKETNENQESFPTELPSIHSRSLSANSGTTISFHESGQSDGMAGGSHMTSLNQSVINNQIDGMDTDSQINSISKQSADSSVHTKTKIANVSAALPSNVLEEDFDVSQVQINFNLDEIDEDILDDQPTLYDLVGSQPVKRTKSGYNAFVKERRPKVVEENPDALYDEITRIVELEWENLSYGDKGKYEESDETEIERGKEKQRESQEEVKKPKALGSKLKRKSLVPPENTPTIREKLLQSTKTTKQQKQKSIFKSAQVPFSMTTLKKKFSTPLGPHQTIDPNSKNVIGCVKSCGVWFCCHGNRIALLNHHRLAETILYYKLLTEHVIPSDKLDQHIQLTKSNVGGEDIWQILLKLVEESSLNMSSSVLDNRLVGNGIDLKFYTGKDQDTSVMVNGLSKSLPTYGIADVTEILSLIATGNAKSLSKARPLKVLTYLQGEAVRMARKLPMHRTREDIQDLVEQMPQYLPKDCELCIHNRPFLHYLYDLDNLPCTQTQTQCQTHS
ncbi:hypothetical protein ScPMuIL_016705 [Solemya velum]